MAKKQSQATAQQMGGVNGPGKIQTSNPAASSGNRGNARGGSTGTRKGARRINK